MKAYLGSKTPDSDPHLFFHTHMVWVWACLQPWDWSARLLPNCSAILITLCLKLSVTISPLLTESITGAAPVLSVVANSTHTRKTDSRGQLVAQPFRNSPNHSLHWSLGEKATGEVWWTENPNKPFGTTRASPGAVRKDYYIIPPINTEPETQTSNYSDSW